MRKPLVAVLMAGTLLAGCTMIPDYTRPVPPVSVDWPLAGMTDTQTPQENPVAAIRWEAFFESPHLREVIQAALEHNRDLRIAALNVDVARTEYQISRADLLPNLSADVIGNRQRISQNLPFDVGNQSFIGQFYTAEVNLSYGLDLFGRVRSMTRAAMQQYLATEEAQRTVQVSLIAEVANAYLQLQADREILRLTEDTLETQERSYDLIRQRFEKGVGTQLELSQARIPVETARVNHALYTRRAMQSRNMLVQLIGKENVETLLAEQRLNSLKLMDDLPVGLPSEVLLLRPDVRAAERQLLAANANIGAARAAFFPSITLTGGVGRASSELSDLFTSSAGTIWNFAPSISVPIFQGGRNFANLDASELRKNIAVAEYEKAIQTAFREVADEMAARATIDHQRKAQMDLVEASQRAYDASNARFRQGVDSFLTVLDAQRSLFSAQQELIEIDKLRLTNTVNLYKVLGGGQLLAEEDTAEAQKELKRQARHAAAAAPKPTYVREVTVVTETPQGAEVEEHITITTQETAEGESENVAEKFTVIRDAE